MIVKPELLMIELEKALRRLGISQQFFTFKVMTPIYPDDMPKITNAKYYIERGEYGFNKERAVELNTIKTISPILSEFQIKANFNR